MTDGPAGEPPIDFNPNRALSETLAGAGHDVDPLCRARLDSLERQHGPIEPPPSGGCALQPVCLGGMQSPMQVTVCADGARAHSPAASAQADTPASAAWIWANGGDTEETVGTPPLAPDTSE